MQQDILDRPASLCTDIMNKTQMLSKKRFHNFNLGQSIRWIKDDQLCMGFFCWKIFIKLVFTCRKKVNCMSFWRILIFWDFSGINCLVYSWENLMSLIFPLGTEQILQSHNTGKTEMKLFMYKTFLGRKVPREKSGRQLQYYHYFT